MATPARVVVLASSLLVFSAPPAAAEDVTITYRVNYGESGTPIRIKYISPDRGKWFCHLGATPCTEATTP